MVNRVVVKKGRGKRGAGDQKKQPQDYFSLLPEEVLWLIISMLPIGDAVRSSILSRRWLNMWKRVPRLDFDAKYMLCPMRRINTSWEEHLDFILNQNKEQGIYRYSILLFLILRQHFGDLTSCRFCHFHIEDIGSWIMYLVEKKPKLKNLTLECIPISGSIQVQVFPMEYYEARVYKDIFSSLESLDMIRYYITNSLSFKASKKLRILTLKDVYIDKEKTLTEILDSCVSLEKFFLLHSYGFSIIKFNNPNLKFVEFNLLSVDGIEISAESLQVLILAYLCCPANKIVIEAPNIKEFFCRGNRRIPTPPKTMRTSRLLEICCGVLASKKMGQIFQNLSSVSIDCDLNNTKEALVLSNMLKASVDLQTLKIVIPPNVQQILGGGRTTRNSTGALQQFSRSSFWEGREICNCIQHKLKYVYVEGFMGKGQEMDFVKYLILRSTKLQNLTLIGMGSTKVASVLFSLKSVSPNLSITLKATRFQSCV